MKVIKITSKTIPYNIFVFPVTNESITVKMESSNSNVDLASIPSMITDLSYKEKTATAGIVSPVLAKAEPSARLILV